MSLEVTLAAERQRREAAEAEAAQLRAQLEALAAEVSAQQLTPDAARNLAEVVSLLRHTEQQLEDQQDLVRQVIDNSPNLVYVEDEEGRCILVNKSYVQLLSQEFIRTRPEEKPAAGATALPPVNPFESTTSFEECYHIQDGQTLWYYTTQSPLVRTDGSRYLLTFSSDITDLKYANRVAEESMRAKQVFMANMSHEIRTPLHGVMGLAELLKKEPLSAEQTDYVNMIQSSTENLLVVINDILDFAKIESGEISLEHIPFDIVQVVQEAARSMSYKIEEKGLLLRFVGLNEHLPLALGDPYRLRQVLVNLIANAVKFTHRGAITITVDASKRSGLALPVTFSVADTGIGISAENQKQIFTSFRQADSSITRVYGGTGLGLTICKDLVELQGGQLGVRSELGQGSCFSFTIPYTVSQEMPDKAPAVVQQPDLLEGLGLLLAEDNAINQLIAVSMLGEWGVRVDMAQNGEEALTKAFQNKYDLILMDIQMPQVDGFEATSRLRAMSGPNQETPIIALTADAIRVNTESYQSLGFTYYLTKPYSESELFRMLAQASRRAQVLTSPPPPPPPADLALHYDFEMLGKLAHNTDFIRKMLELFIDQVPGQITTLQAAVEHENWDAVAREAHRLKTTFGSLNIQPEAAQLKLLEEMAAAGAPKSEFIPLVTAIAKATQLFIALFHDELTQLPQPS